MFETITNNTKKITPIPIGTYILLIKYDPVELFKHILC